ncbi:MAG: 3'(2'),5'-bisphosphate nucleotidase CysQ [Alphaproteobacteria bacterium]|nr:3'(2'),5'-bisphosphate nucleotidase CysQ [Alphaproteobacteria bacterium]
MDEWKQNFDSLAARVVTLAKKAGNIICQIYESDFEVFKKKDGSPVTQADHESHFLLKMGLENLTPAVPVISEEDESSWAIKSPYYWLIDPLDGTKGFIKKTGEFCINIALMEKDRPIFGLIHIPLKEETFYGYSNCAWKQANGKISSIHARFPPSQGMNLLLSGYGKTFKEQRSALLKSYPITKIETIHSAIKFCHIAAGQADLYIRFAPCGEWDTAAGHILVEAAGGKMTKLNGTPFLYGKPGLINEGFIVSGITL